MIHRHLCPKCQAIPEDERYISAIKNTPQYYIYCPDCKIYGSDSDTLELATRSWNNLCRKMTTHGKL